MLVSFSKALKSANTFASISVFTSWKLELNKWLNLCCFLEASVVWEGIWIFPEAHTNLGRKENYIIQITLWPFFTKGMAKQKYQLHRWILLGKKTIVAQQSMFSKIHC